MQGAVRIGPIASKTGLPCQEGSDSAFAAIRSRAPMRRLPQPCGAEVRDRRGPHQHVVALRSETYGR